MSGSTTSAPRNISSASERSRPCFRWFARFLSASHSNVIVAPNVATSTRKTSQAHPLREYVDSPVLLGDGCHRPPHFFPELSRLGTKCQLPTTYRNRCMVLA